MMEVVDVVVVGGGAAGLAAAIFAGESGRGGRRIVVLDGARSLGAKILVSGGGRCNVTHDHVGVEDYNGSRNIVRNVLAAFDAEATVRWFASMGVELKREETGKLFPVSDSARTVLGALLRRCEEVGVMIRTGSRARGIVAGAGGEPFRVAYAGGEMGARRVVMATGGRSLPRSGSDGAGWEMVRRLGHSVTETYPALVPLVLEKGMFHGELSGISQEVELTTFAGGKVIDRRRGSLLWTHFGISGPVVMDASRHWVIAQARGERPEMRCSFVPGEGFEAVERWLIDEAGAQPRTSIGKVVGRRVPERVAGAIVARCGIEAGIACGQVTREDRRNVVHALTGMMLPVAGDRGWNYAEVTAGGVPLNEIDYRTMESRKAEGLYLVGEMLDCDGRIGGFNFQWAWATGYLAGIAD